ncbi:hypothetical protein Vsou_16640 [Vulcanisaeta souniana JCM 11219]|uniref:Uncharacterized protein n=1 Tax=Vulcanisaeta souniana JCM 11219 TaxID=1293586 RepID=A0ABM8BNH6_9CREN|nr:hypothetical protein Vsou_16640 [Vulcanisaeta souniana JCM 11219]
MLNALLVERMVKNKGYGQDVVPAGGKRNKVGSRFRCHKY